MITEMYLENVMVLYVFFVAKKEMKCMPTNKKGRALFVLITVIITVYAYVSYGLYVVNGA